MTVSLEKSHLSISDPGLPVSLNQVFLREREREKSFSINII